MGNWPTVSRQTGNARLGREGAWKAGGQQAGGRGGVLMMCNSIKLECWSTVGQGEGISFKAEFISWIFCIGTGMFAFVEDSLDALKLFIAHGDGL